MVRSRRPRGVTLLELMISLAVIVTGMLGMFRVLGTSVAASSSSSRVAQAHQRAAAIVEAIRLAPDDALTCLRNTATVNWSTCETICLQRQTAGAGAHASSCIFTPLAFENVPGPATGQQTGSVIYDQRFDRTGQQYMFAIGAAPTAQTDPAAYGSTYVRQVGDGLRTWEIVVSIAWNDDNSTTITPAPFPHHTISVISGVFR